MSADSTKKLYLQGLASSFVNLVVVSLNSLLVIRLSLSYLGKEEYGLLSLLSQVAMYICILDLGLSVSFSRIMIDYTTGTKERYAKALKTASRVFNIVGSIGFLTAVIVAMAGGSALSIPDHLHRQFVILMIAQGGSLWLQFHLKTICAPLIAHGKLYVILWLNSALTLLNVLVFWLALSGGIGIYSSFIAQGAQLVVSMFLFSSISKPYRPPQGTPGKFDSSIFKEVVSFARDSMLWQIGGQTLASMPILLASAWYALNTTADLSAGMKLILLLVSVCTRFGDMSVTPLSIEFANGNEAAAATQMTRIAGVAGGIGALAALFIVSVNPAFISWWMLDKVSWAWHANMTGAVWVAIISVTQCMYGYAVVSRQMRLIRWALLAECLMYLMLAITFRHWAGSACLLWAKPVATLIIGLCVAWQLKKHTRFDTSRLLPGLLRQGFALALLIPFCIYFGRLIPIRIHQPFIVFLASGVLAGVAMLVALPLLFTRETRADLLRILKGFLVKFRRQKQKTTSFSP